MEGLFPLQKELEKRIEWLKCEGGGGGEEFGCQKPVEKEQVGNKQQADLKKLENIFFN